MVFGIIGSREFTNYNKLKKCLIPYRKYMTKIVSGGAKGADTLAKKYAEENKIPFVEFLPDYGNDGKQAPLIRNTYIVKTSDIIIAFWNLESNGTRHTLKTAKASEIPYIIFG